MSTGEEDSRKEQKMKKNKKKEEDRDSEGTTAMCWAWRGDFPVCLLSQMAARGGVSLRRCWSDGESLCSPAPVCLRSDLEAVLRLADVSILTLFPALRCLCTCPAWSEVSSGPTLSSTLAAESADGKEAPTTCCCVMAAAADTTPTVCGPA